jgi:hypothetical protein
LLSFELKRPEGEQPFERLEVALDAAGLESLLAQLHFLKDGQTEHVHLMAKAWGGSHLTDEPLYQENIPIRHVKFMLR